VPRIYEIHDSILHGIDREDAQVTVNLCAIRTEFDESASVPGRAYRQEIKLTLKETTIEIDSGNLPNWLLNGHFRYSRCTATSADIVDDEIPVSLTRAADVNLRLEGMNEDTQEYITIQINARSMTLEVLGEPEFIQEY